MEYIEYQLKKEIEFERLCKRCGNCCGAKEDPCVHLVFDANGKSFCSIYNNRIGLHKTRSGKDFRCVMIRQILNTDWPGSQHCAYKKRLKYTNVD